MENDGKKELGQNLFPLKRHVTTKENRNETQGTGGLTNLQPRVNFKNVAKTAQFLIMVWEHL